VGKTTLATTLAWYAATGPSARRTLLWDLDPQAAASWLLSTQPREKTQARAVFTRSDEAEKYVEPTAIPNLSLLSADRSLRGLDRFFQDLAKRKRLSKLTLSLNGRWDRVLLDCPPGLTATADQAIRAAKLIIVPVVPSPLARRAFEEVVTHLREEHGGAAPILPVFNMMDRRRSLHIAAAAELPDWPIIPMASALESLTANRPLSGPFPSGTVAGQAIARLWRGIEQKLAG
jgi:cellulose biosynthesis protein BcsQ